MKRIISRFLLVLGVLVLAVPPVAAELAIVVPQGVNDSEASTANSPKDNSLNALQRAEELLEAHRGRVLFTNPHDGQMLVDVPAAEIESFAHQAPIAVVRDIEELPTARPGFTVRALIYATDFSGVDELVAEVERLGGTEVWRGKGLPVVHLDIPITALGYLRDHPLVSSFYFDRAGRPTLANSVPLIGVNGSYGPSYWPASWRSYYVAVLDGGVTSAGSLGSRVDHSLDGCFSTGGGGWVSLCPNNQPDGDPYVELAPNAALPCNVSQRDCLHGSKVAAVIASATSPNFGVVAASNVKILPLQVWSYSATGHIIRILASDVQKAYDYLVQFGMFGYRISAVNMSFEWGFVAGDAACPNDPLASYVATLKNYGIASVAAAGNVYKKFSSAGISPVYYHATGMPACIPDVIAVGASSDLAPEHVAVNVVAPNDYYFSSRSSTQVDFWAPGINISTPIAATSEFGTSFAAPHVAGVITRLRGRYPAATVDSLVDLMKSGVCPSLTDTRTEVNPLTRTRVCWSPAWQ